jgi:hypothetical protein
LSAVPDVLAFEDFPPGEIVDYGGIEVSADETSSLRASSTRSRSTSTKERRARPSAAQGIPNQGKEIQIHSEVQSKPKETKSKSGETKSKRKGKQNLSFFSPVIEILQRLKP